MISFPGHEDPGKNCQEPLLWGCHDDKTYFIKLSKCMAKTCPNCYEDWAYREGLHAAERMTEFLNSPDYMKVLQNAEKERWHSALTDDEASVEQRRLYRIQTYHISISFRDVEISNGEDIAKYRKDARDIARRHGLFGECTIPHQRDRDDEGAHFHFLALAGFIAPGRDDGTNYIFKVIKHPKYGHPRSLLGRLGVVKYACTHAILAEGRDCVTWSGCVANNRFPGVAEVEHFHQTATCPHCGGPATFKVRRRDWHFREEVEIWTAPDRPPPNVEQRCLVEFD